MATACTPSLFHRRMAHNPPIPARLDFMDRLGMLALDENRDYGDVGDRDFEPLPAQLTDMRDLVKRDRSHPSVMVCERTPHTRSNRHECARGRGCRHLPPPSSISARSRRHPARFMLMCARIMTSSLSGTRRGLSATKASATLMQTQSRSATCRTSLTGHGQSPRTESQEALPPSTSTFKAFRTKTGKSSTRSTHRIQKSR